MPHFARRTIAAMSCMLLLASTASAQGIRTVTEVDADLTQSCVFDANGALIDPEACIASIRAAIDTAADYESLDEVPPQVDIGFLLCQLAVLRPGLAPDIIGLVNQSENANLAVGCSNALGPDWDGPPLVFSPA